MKRRRAGCGKPHIARTLGSLSITATVTLVMVGATPTTGASAEPEPSRGELTKQQEKLADQAEQLTEQYNGLRLRLEQAQRAAKVAENNAKRRQRDMEAVRSKVAQMAADSYKSGGVDSAITLATSSDPQSLLDRSASVNYFAQQNGTLVATLLQSMQSAERARKAAADRAGQVRELADQLREKRQRVQKLLKKVESKLGVRTQAGPAPDVAPGGASAKAMGAVNAALSQLGVPYSWGGGSSSGPSYGVDQGSNIKGYDCSGLTMYAYAQVGINLPHYTGAQWNSGTHVTRDQLRPGDLVFFYSDLHHMGMYIGNGNMVHAPQTGDVVKVGPISGRPWAGAVRIA